jgi:hypothetical protein
MSTTVNCWKDEKECIEEIFGRDSQEWFDCWERYEHGGRTCMLAAGHEGSHEWTRDSDITVSFEEGKKR